MPRSTGALQPSTRPHVRTTQVSGGPHPSRRVAHNSWPTGPTNSMNPGMFHKDSTGRIGQLGPPAHLQWKRLAAEWHPACRGASSGLERGGALLWLQPHRPHPKDSARHSWSRFEQAAPECQTSTNKAAQLKQLPGVCDVILEEAGTTANSCQASTKSAGSGSPSSRYGPDSCEPCSPNTAGWWSIAMRRCNKEEEEDDDDDDEEEAHVKNHYCIISYPHSWKSASSVGLPSTFWRDYWKNAPFIPWPTECIWKHVNTSEWVKKIKNLIGESSK